MSALAGVLNLDGAPVDPSLLERMAERLAYRSPDGMGSWRDGAVGLAHGRLWTTPEEVGEEQPLRDPECGLALAADARIDNREELLALLGDGPGGRQAGVSDAGLILAAYRELGEGFCERLLGDFAFALWDGRRRRLLLARDALAMRQLFYAQAGQSLVFGTTIGSVLAALPERPPLNRNLIEAFLQGSYRPWIRETVHQGVLRFPPATLLVADAGGVRLRRWWRPGDTFRGAFSSDEEWVEAFGEVFERSVRCRLRGTTPVGIMAGGGLDSAAIACVARRALRGEQASLRVFALTFEETPSADEREYLDELAAWLDGVPVHRIPADHLPLGLEPVAGHGPPLDEPPISLLRSQGEALLVRAAQSGCRVVLTGDAANAVLGHSFYGDPRALGFLGWRERRAELPYFRARRGQGTLELLARALFWPRLPAGIREALRRLAGGRGKGWVRPAGPGSWRRRLPPLPRPERGRRLPPSGRWAARSIERPFDLARHGMMDVTAAWAGVEWRQPFLDRRLVDLMMHVPPRLRSWRGEDRRILRLSMRGKMPERIRRRRTKIHTNDVLQRRLRQEQRPAVERLLDKPLARRLDFVAGSTGRAFEDYWQGNGNPFGLLYFLYLESWLRLQMGTSGVNAEVSSERRKAVESGRARSDRRRRGRPYRRPELEEYGRLKELTRNLEPGDPGDVFSTSFAN